MKGILNTKPYISILTRKMPTRRLGGTGMSWHIGTIEMSPVGKAGHHLPSSHHSEAGERHADWQVGRSWTNHNSNGSARVRNPHWSSQHTHLIPAPCRLVSHLAMEQWRLGEWRCHPWCNRLQPFVWLHWTCPVMLNGLLASCLLEFLKIIKDMTIRIMRKRKDIPLFYALFHWNKN